MYETLEELDIVPMQSVKEQRSHYTLALADHLVICVCIPIWHAL